MPEGSQGRGGLGHAVPSGLQLIPEVFSTQSIITKTCALCVQENERATNKENFFGIA